MMIFLQNFLQLNYTWYQWIKICFSFVHFCEKLMLQVKLILKIPTNIWEFVKRHKICWKYNNQSIVCFHYEFRKTSSTHLSLESKRLCISHNICSIAFKQKTDICSQFQWFWCYLEVSCGWNRCVKEWSRPINIYSTN